MMQSDQTLFNLFAAYLHQDWPDEYSSYQEAIRAFAKECPMDVAKAICAAENLKNCPEFVTNPKRTLLELGCYYDPTYNEVSPADWIDDVIRILKSSQV